LSEIDETKQDPMNLTTKFMEIYKGESYEELKKSSTTLDFEYVKFPMVSLQKEIDISYFEGASYSKFPIAEAKKEVLLKINEKGAHAKAAVAITARGISMRKSYTFQKPFLLWIYNKKLGLLPLFVAVIDYSDWKNPGEL
jgi:serine protease inhibitor